MKKVLYFSGLIAIFALLAFTLQGEKEDIKPLEIGSKAPKTSYKMKDVSGEMKSLKQIKGEKGLLVIFSCNTCPFVLRWESEYPKLQQFCENQDLGMVLVNSNAAQRNDADSFEAMKEHAEDKNYNTNYVLDENSELADAFGAKTTPHVFLFNSNNILVYEGSIDNRYENNEIVSQRYLEEAMEYMLAGKEIPVPNSKAIGCSIKRVKK